MLMDAGDSPSTERDAYQRLRSMLDVAVRYRLISADPAKDVDLAATDAGRRTLPIPHTLI
jgi:hypothetical protein